MYVYRVINDWNSLPDYIIGTCYFAERNGARVTSSPQLYVLFKATGVGVGRGRRQYVIHACTPNRAPNAPCCYHLYSPVTNIVRLVTITIDLLVSSYSTANTAKHSIHRENF